MAVTSRNYAVALILTLAAVGCSSDNPSGDSAAGHPTADGGASAIENEAAVQDAALETYNEFDCGNGGAARFRFLGPETIELVVAGESRVLQRQRTASGARYSDDAVDFWNKGDEAMLTIAEERHSCVRLSGE